MGWEARLKEIDEKEKLDEEETRVKFMRTVFEDIPNVNEMFVTRQELGWRIRDDFDNGISQNQLAKKYRVSRRTIGRILKKYTTPKWMRECPMFMF